MSSLDFSNNICGCRLSWSSLSVNCFQHCCKWRDEHIYTCVLQKYQITLNILEDKCRSKIILSAVSQGTAAIFKSFHDDEEKKTPNNRTVGC